VKPVISVKVVKTSKMSKRKTWRKASAWLKNNAGIEKWRKRRGEKQRSGIGVMVIEMK
jgi:hypothetical protein